MSDTRTPFLEAVSQVLSEVPFDPFGEAQRKLSTRRRARKPASIASRPGPEMLLPPWQFGVRFDSVGDSHTRTLLEVAAPVPRAEQVVVRVATHFVGCYLSAVHGENEPELDEPAAVEAFAAELRKVRRDWRARRSQIQGVDALAADEILGMLKQLRFFTGIHEDAEVRSELGAVIRGFVARVVYRDIDLVDPAIVARHGERVAKEQAAARRRDRSSLNPPRRRPRQDSALTGVLRWTDVALHHLIGDPETPDDPGADYAVTKPSWAADLEEAQRVTAEDQSEPEVTGDRARVRPYPADPSSGDLSDQHSFVLQVVEGGGVTVGEASPEGEG